MLFRSPDLDHDATPSTADALAVRAERATRVGEFLASLPVSDLARPVEVLEDGTNPLQECVYTVLEEAFWHNRYAQRDLTLLDEARTPTLPPTGAT